MKRALALLLAGVMSLSTAFTPVSAWAAEQTPEVTVEDTVEAASVETQLPGETLVEETGAPAEEQTVTPAEGEELVDPTGGEEVTPPAEGEEVVPPAQGEEITNPDGEGTDPAGTSEEQPIETEPLPEEQVEEGITEEIELVEEEAAQTYGSDEIVLYASGKAIFVGEGGRRIDRIVISGVAADETFTAADLKALADDNLDPTVASEYLKIEYKFYKDAALKEAIGSTPTAIVESTDAKLGSGRFVYVEYTPYGGLVVELDDQLLEEFYIDDPTESDFEAIDMSNIAGTGAAYFMPSELTKAGIKLADVSVDVVGPYAKYDESEPEFFKTVYTFAIPGGKVTLPTPVRGGYVWSHWYNPDTKKQIKNASEAIGINGLTFLETVWVKTGQVEVQLGPTAGYAHFPEEVLTHRWSPDDNGQTGEWHVDGYLHVTTGNKISTAFSTEIAKNNSGTKLFTKPPVADPIPDEGVKAVFLGWELSTDSTRLYTSDELMEVKVDGPLFITAKWEEENVAMLTFHDDEHTHYIIDTERRTRTENGEDLVKFVRIGENAAAQMNVKTSPDNYTDLDPKGNTRKWIRYAWTEDDVTPVGTIFDGDADLYPLWQDTSKSYVTKMQLATYNSTDKKYVVAKDSKSMKKAEKLTLYAYHSGEKLSTHFFETDWSVEEYNSATKSWIPVTGTTGHVLRYTGSETTTGATGFTVTAYQAGQARIVARSVEYGYTDMILIDVDSTVNDFKLKDEAQTKVLLKPVGSSPKLIQNVNFLVSPRVVSNGKLYVEMTREADKPEYYNDFVTLTQVRKNTSGTTYTYSSLGTDWEDTSLVPRKYMPFSVTEEDKYVTEENQDSGYSQFTLQLGVNGNLRAGSTTMTITPSTAPSKKIKIQVVVEGYDAVSNRFYKSDGTFVTNAWKKVGDRDVWFDKDGKGIHYGVVKMPDGTHVLINDMGVRNDFEGPVTVGGDEYYTNANGVVQYGKLCVNPNQHLWHFYDKENDGKKVVPGDDGEDGRWMQYEGHTYYVEEDGALAFGHQTIDGEEYYFYTDANKKGDAKECRMMTGWQDEKIGTSTYKFYYDTLTGRKLLGLVHDGSAHYFVHPGKGKLVPASADLYASGAVSPAGTFVGVNGSANPVWKDKALVPAAIMANDTYFVDKNGKVQTNKLITVDKTDLYYVGADGRVVRNEMIEVGGKWYAFGNYGRAEDQFGSFRDPLKTDGWQNALYDTTKKLWIDQSTGKTLTKVWVQGGGMDDIFYVQSGKPVTGFRNIQELEGGKKVTNTYYFFANGILMTPETAEEYENSVAYDNGIYRIGSKYYAIEDNGKLKKDQWIFGDDGDIFYAGSGDNGAMVTGKKSLKSSVDGPLSKAATYYFDTQTGLLLTGIVPIGDKLYFLNDGFDPSAPYGAVLGLNDWLDYLGATVFVKSDGSLQTGFASLKSRVDGKKYNYYFYEKDDFEANEEKGALAREGLLTRIEGNKVVNYCINDEGYRVSGWVATSVDGEEKCLFLESNGKATVGKKKVVVPDWDKIPALSDGEIFLIPSALNAKGKTYTENYVFDNEGFVVKGYMDGLEEKTVRVKVGNTVYEIGADGVPKSKVTEGIVSLDGDRYYTGTNGSLKSGMVKDAAGNRYIFDATTKEMVRSTITKAGGKWYFVDKAGRVQNSFSGFYFLIGREDSEAYGRFSVTVDAATGAIKHFANEKNEVLKNAVIFASNSNGSFVLNGSGQIQTGEYSVKKLNDTWYYYTGKDGNLENYLSGDMDTGVLAGNPLFVTADNKTYFYQDQWTGKQHPYQGVAQLRVWDSDFEEFVPKDYYVNAKGIVQTNTFVTLQNGLKLYVDKNGHAGNGWYLSGGDWYLVNNGRGVAGEHAMELFDEATRKMIFATCVTDHTGKQVSVWKDTSGKSLSGLYTRVTDEDDLVQYYMSGGKMKTGKVKRYSFNLHAFINIELDEHGERILNPEER